MRHYIDNLDRLRELSNTLIEPDFALIVIEALPDAIVLMDSSYIIQLVNRQTEIIFGYSRKDLIGNHINVLVPEDKHKKHIDHLIKYFEQPVARQLPRAIIGKCKDGTLIQVAIDLQPLETSIGILALATVRKI